MKLDDILLSDNILPNLDSETHSEIVKQVCDQYTMDYDSMSGWREKYDKAMKLARMDSAQIDTKLKGGAKLMMPYLMEACLDFNARVVMEVLSRDEVIWIRAMGKPSEDKEERAHRVTEYVNYKLRKSNWRTASDKESLILPLVGTTYKKNWIDPIDMKPCSAVIPADKVIFSHDVQSFDEAPQTVEIMEKSLNDIVSMQRAGLWEIDVNELDDEIPVHELWEVCFRYDLDEDGYAEPYIGVYCEQLNKMIRIVAAFDVEDIRFNENEEILKVETTDYLVQKVIIPDPDCKPYGLGFGILLGDLFESINMNTRQLVDAGTLHNMSANSGLVAHGVKPKGNQVSQYDTGEIEMEMGVFKQVQVAGGMSLRESIMQMPFGGASPVLFQLMQHLEGAARRLAMAGQGVEAQAGEAASMYLAKLNQAMKMPNAMIWRLMQGYEKEFRAIVKMLYVEADNEDYQKVLDEPEADIQTDLNYEDCDIMPVADMSQGSDFERIQRAEVLKQTALEAPQMHNVREAYERYYEALGVMDIEEILPEPDPNAQDPMQQLQYQYLAMEAEFKDREMQVKEGKLALDKMKMVHDMRSDIEKMKLEMETADAQRAKTIAESIQILASIADMEERKALFTVQNLMDTEDRMRQRFSQMSDEELMRIASGG